MNNASFIILFLFVFVSLRAQNNNVNSLEFAFTGDIMCHSTQFKFAAVGKDSFDFKPTYREIKPYFDNCDVVVGNLETVVEVKGVKYSGYPVFNTPEDFLEGLKFAGFNILSTANNHAYDLKERGVLSTINHIHSAGMDNVGTYKTERGRDSVCLFEKNRIKFAILSYTYGVNLYTIPNEKSFLVNRINEELIKKDIINYRNEGADLIILFFHFGKEYAKVPDKFQKELVAKAIKFGADIIIGSHPHTLQPVKFFKSQGKIDTGFTAYSLGNFISNQRWRYSDGGAVLNFSVEKNMNNGKIKLKSVKYLPIWVFKGYTDNGSEYVILPADTAINDTHFTYLQSNDLKLMRECYYDTKEILQKETKKISIDSIPAIRKRQKAKKISELNCFVDIPLKNTESKKTNATYIIMDSLNINYPKLPFNIN
jgi:poly-gamma-glutamate synthesis protein (capsule biosynthesis protein)